MDGILTPTNQAIIKTIWVVNSRAYTVYLLVYKNNEIYKQCPAPQIWLTCLLIVFKYKWTCNLLDGLYEGFFFTIF